MEFCGSFVTLLCSLEKIIDTILRSGAVQKWVIAGGGIFNGRLLSKQIQWKYTSFS